MEVLQAKNRKVYFRSQKYNIFFKRDLLSKEPLNPVQKTKAWLPPNSVAQNPATKDVPRIKITSGRETSGKSQGHTTVFMTRILFSFFFFITFCIKLKSFFSLQHTLSCESDVKEVERVGQKTL